MTANQPMEASSLPKEKSSSPKPPAFFLAGDSTAAIHSCHGGGWGDGFLSCLKPPAWGLNFGHNGATTVSFVEDGDWANVMKQVKDNTGKYNVYVTIQFGHNDQKPAANISSTSYQRNLEDLAITVKKAGATPVS